MIITEHFFTDADRYGAARGPLLESEELRRRIEALRTRKWFDPADRDEIDETLADLQARLAFLEANPDQDRVP